MTKRTGIIATSDNVNEMACGAITWWELKGYASHERLTDAWIAAGLPENLAPRATGEVAALRRALNNTVGHELIRPLDGQGAWAIVHEKRKGSKGDAKLNYTVQARVWLSEAVYKREEPRKLEWDFDGSTWSAKMQKSIAAAIEGEYLEQMDLVSHHEVSGWLIGICKHGVQGVGLREKGGMYYVPKAYMPMWKKVAKVLSDNTGHKIKRIPALTSSDAIEAVTDAVLAEADQLIGQVNDLLKDKDAGKRALQTRKGYLERMLGKLEAYDGMLGDRLNAVRQRVTKAQTKVVRAELQIESRKASEGKAA